MLHGLQNVSANTGQAADSLIFYPIAFWGIWSVEALMAVVAFNFVFKVGVEVAFTPLTYTGLEAREIAALHAEVFGEERGALVL